MTMFLPILKKFHTELTYTPVSCTIVFMTHNNQRNIIIGLVKVQYCYLNPFKIIQVSQNIMDTLYIRCQQGCEIHFSSHAPIYET